MTDLSVIILTKNEQLHIARCLERLAPLSPRQIFIVDCFSTDNTKSIVESFTSALQLQLTPTTKSSTLELQLKTPTKSSALQLQLNTTTISLVERAWPGLYAKQFNWVLDNLPIESKWVLRLDADEYLTPETIERLKESLPKLPDDVSGLTLELKRKFMGGEIRHGTNGIRLLRVFKYGIGRCEERAMDEHILLSEGRCVDFDGAFYDDNLNTFEWWQEKHRGYAKREAQDAISLFNNPDRLKNPSETDNKKIKYYKLPPYFRAVAYFCIRYFLKLGFLDGVPGWKWHFYQGLWYRWLVDREIGKVKRRQDLQD